MKLTSQVIRRLIVETLAADPLAPAAPASAAAGAPHTFRVEGKDTPEWTVLPMAVGRGGGWNYDETSDDYGEPVQGLPPEAGVPADQLVSVVERFQEHGAEWTAVTDEVDGWRWQTYFLDDTALLGDAYDQFVQRGVTPRSRGRLC